MRVVFKFGGTSLANGERIRHAAELVKNYLSDNKIVVVCSAMGDTTDNLLEAIDAAVNRDKKRVDDVLSELSSLHLEAIDKAVSVDSIKREIYSRISENIGNLSQVLHSIYFLREATPRTRDYVLSFGERMSSRIMYGALMSLRIEAKYLEGGEAGIITDSSFGEAQPIMEVAQKQVRERVGGLLERNITPVVTGFIGMTVDGAVTTLGRGGSDYTATIIAYAINAEEVWLWSDVDGLMTTDPRIVNDARVLPEISFEEAMEMALFGAKGLHPRALEPARMGNIRVRIKNTFNPSAPGTLISESARGIDSVVKAVLLVRDVAMITLRGASVVGRAGTAGRILSTLGRLGINIMMISQSVSESALSFIVKRKASGIVVSELEREFVKSGQLKEVECEPDVSVIAVIGGGMRGTPGVASRVFGAVAKRGISIRMIAQGSSELNISFVVKEKDGEEAVKAIHEEYGLGSLKL
ncbi:MAG: aspartate kinase [Nitrososphaerota archaeon]